MRKHRALHALVADDVITNDADMSAVQNQVAALHIWNAAQPRGWPTPLTAPFTTGAHVKHNTGMTDVPFQEPSLRRPIRDADL
jgi:hypothetical protein